MTIVAGSFPHQVHIQRRKPGGALGQPSNTWENVTPSPIWANVKHLSGGESIKAGADVSTVRASIRIRWRTWVEASMRVLYGSTAYQIEAVLPGGNRQHVDLVCKVVGNGTG